MKKEFCVKLVIYKDRISRFVYTRHFSQYVEPVPHFSQYVEPVPHFSQYVEPVPHFLKINVIIFDVLR